MFWAVLGVTLGGSGLGNVLLPQPRVRDLSGRATESFTCTESSKCSHFVEELVQCKAKAVSMPLAEAECRQIRAQDSRVVLVITVIF